MAWTVDEIEDIVTKYFGGAIPKCSECSARVEVRELEVSRRWTTDLILNCPRCGFHERYSSKHIAILNLNWTPGEINAIVDAYWINHMVRCPNDNAILKTKELRAARVSKVDLMVQCCRCGRHFSTREANMAVDPLSFKGRYEHIRELASGGMGRVFLVRDKKTNKTLAAKKILSKYLNSEEAVRRFQREIRLLSALSHPNIVEIRDHFLDESGAVYVMDYMQGSHLGNAIRDKNVSNENIIVLFSGLVSGINYMHSIGIVHRDLKPQNVLIDAMGNARISDFGLAVPIVRDSTVLTGENQFLGTDLYAAPEQKNNARDVDHRADIYALGLMAYEILIRASPYRVVRFDNVPTRLTTLITTAIEPDPKLRSATASELLEALQSYLIPN